MIADIIKLSALYVLVRVFIEIAMPSSKVVVKYLFWTGVALTVVAVVSPYTTRALDDIHNASVTYTKVKGGVQTVTDGVNAVTSLPDKLNNLPIIGTGPSKSPPALNMFEGFFWNKKFFDYPVSGKITQGFSAEHGGIDIACPIGTPVKNSREGKVVTVAYDDRSGNYVIVDHGGQWQTLYCHMSRIDVKNGDLVKTGQALGLSGNTGLSTGPHLHFEIRQGNKSLNPKEWLK